MNVTRRGFVAAAGAALGACATSESLLAFADEVAPEEAPSDEELATEASSSITLSGICDGCSGGCGITYTVENGAVLNVIGDAIHPLNAGSLCQRGMASIQKRELTAGETCQVSELAVVSEGADQAEGEEAPAPIPEQPMNPVRVTTPKVRRPGAADWEDISWEEALAEITANIKDTRDATFTEIENEVTVNRCNGIASFGGDRLTCEEQFLLGRALRGWGVTAIHSGADSLQVLQKASRSTLGIDAPGGSWSDLTNANAILVIGADPVHDHPLVARWLNNAMQRGTQLVVVDPVHTRTAEIADIYCPLRPGSDTAFFGGLINYLIKNDKWQPEYVINYTNASYVLNDGYSFDAQTGTFAGWNNDVRAYDKLAWGYMTAGENEWSMKYGTDTAWVLGKNVPTWTQPKLPVPVRDVTMQHEKCVWQQLKAHYERYDIDTVAALCGVKPELLTNTYNFFASTCTTDGVGAVILGSGLTRQQNGAQNVRAALMVQLLLGNMGVPGGGLHCLSGESNTQGALANGLLPDQMPGGMPWPTANEPTLRDWMEAHTQAAGYTVDYPKRLISLLAELWGETATVGNDFGYVWLPKNTDESPRKPQDTYDAMERDEIKGCFVWSANPCGIGVDTVRANQAFSHLDWLVVGDCTETETAAFWKAPGVQAASIPTTVFMLPTALAMEKEGVRINSGRWMQYSPAVVWPQGEAKTELEIIDSLWASVAEKYALESGVSPGTIALLKWDYTTEGVLDARKVAWAMNGYVRALSAVSADVVELIPDAGMLAADGSVACGVSSFAGFWSNNTAPLEPYQQMVGSRMPDGGSTVGLHSLWGFAYPHNVRVRGNRASCNLAGEPWHARNRIIAFNMLRWSETDAADFPVVVDGKDAQPDNRAFPGNWERVARLFSAEMTEGPFPEHYDYAGLDSANGLNGFQGRPGMSSADEEVAGEGTYRVLATVLRPSAGLAFPSEDALMPAYAAGQAGNHVTISVALASAIGVSTGDRVRVSSNAGSAVMTALVTDRLKTFAQGDNTLEGALIWAPYGWMTAQRDGADHEFGAGAAEAVLPLYEPNAGTRVTSALLVSIERA